MRVAAPGGAVLVTSVLAANALMDWSAVGSPVGQPGAFLLRDLDLSRGRDFALRIKVAMQMKRWPLGAHITS